MHRIALNMSQIEQHQPPPNPAKLTDSRAKDYIANYGNDSWELDALNPATLEELIESHIVEERDDKLWEEMATQEDTHQQLLEKASTSWEKVVGWLNSQERKTS